MDSNKIRAYLDLIANDFAINGEALDSKPIGKHPDGTNCYTEHCRRMTSQRAVSLDKKYGTETSGIVKLANALNRGSLNRGEQKHFKLAKTSTFLKSLGIKGDYFTIRKGVITKHYGKDEDHNLTGEDWVSVATSLNEDKPNVVSVYRDKNGEVKGYRIWTTAEINGKMAVVGATVDQVNRELFVNKVITVFGWNPHRIEKSDVLFAKDNKEIQALLGDLNCREYLGSPVDELSIAQDSFSCQSGDFGHWKTIFCERRGVI